MRLVIATPLYPPEPGGPATYAKILEEGLSLHGMSVEVVKFSEVRHLPKLIRHIAYYLRVKRALKGADALLALDPVSVGLPALKAAQDAQKPFFVKVVGDYAWEQGTQRFSITAALDEFVKMKDEELPFSVRMLRTIERYVAQRAKKVIVPSMYLKGIVASWGISKEKIAVVYNAVPVGSAGTVPEVINRLPRPLVVSVGRLVPWKGMDGLIDAVALLRARGVKASLAIIGDGPELEPLSAQATTRLTDGYVLAGKLSHEDTIAVMKSADVFVLNTSYEGLSHTLIEAMSLGVPVVTTGAGGNAEITSDGVDVLWANPDSAETLAEALNHIVSDKILATRLADAARARAGRAFSVETLLTETASELTSV